MNITIVGGGYVGVTTAVALAEHGHEVTVVEIDDDRRQGLAKGTPHFHEPGLEEALAPLIDQGQVSTASSITEAKSSQVVLLCVGTPQGEDGSADLSQLEAASQEVAATIETWPGFVVVATKSTVPPGTGRTVVQPVLDAKGFAIGQDVGIASLPEFLREGNALQDARTPDRIVIGTHEEDDRSATLLEQVYEAIDAPIVSTSLETAELIKYASNALLATKISFANEIANLAQPLGIDVDEVMEGVGLDHRISPHFLDAGAGFGGSCFPKDLAALIHTADQHDVELGILKAALANNQTQPLETIRLLEQALGTEDLAGKRIALLGLAFKPGTSDVRETRALPIYRALVEAGAVVVCCDPVASSEFEALVGRPLEGTSDPEKALAGADACILQTAWPIFSKIPASTFTELMADPVVIDGRRALDRQALIEAGVVYRAIGWGGSHSSRS